MANTEDSRNAGASFAVVAADGGGSTITLAGNWITTEVVHVDDQMRALFSRVSAPVDVDLSTVEELDTVPYM